MTSKDIRNKVKSILINTNQSLFMITLATTMITLVITKICGLSGGLLAGLISMALPLLIGPISHGNVVASMRAVNEDYEALSDTKENILYGFTNYKNLILTYLVYNGIPQLLGVVLVIVAIVLLAAPLAMAGLGMTELLAISAGSQSIDPVTIYNLLASSAIIIFIVAIITIVVMIMYSLHFLLTPYVYQRFGIEGIAAMKKSSQLMNGYKWLYVKVIFVYVLIMMAISVPISLVLGFLPQFLLDLIISVVTIYFVSVKISVATAILFEEAVLANEPPVYNQDTQTQVIDEQEVEQPVQEVEAVEDRSSTVE